MGLWNSTSLLLSWFFIVHSLDPGGNSSRPWYLGTQFDEVVSTVIVVLVGISTPLGIPCRVSVSHLCLDELHYGSPYVEVSLWVVDPILFRTFGTSNEDTPIRPGFKFRGVRLLIPSVRQTAENTEIANI